MNIQKTNHICTLIPKNDCSLIGMYTPCIFAGGLTLVYIGVGSVTIVIGSMKDQMCTGWSTCGF